MKLGRNVERAGLLLASATAPAFAKIHPRDRFAELVYSHPELSGQTAADDAGRNSLPLAADVDTIDLQPLQIAQRLRSRLASFARASTISVFGKRVSP